MAHAVSPWQQFLQRLEHSPLLPPQFEFTHLQIPSRLKGSSNWMLGIVAIALLLLWDWKLLLSAGTGIVVLGIAYAIQQWNWDGFPHVVRQSIASPNRPLAVAVASGGLAALGIYLGLAIWMTADRPWLATGAIVQGIATFFILAILIGQNLNRFLKPEERDLYEILTHLTDADPLKRLIAVRQVLKTLKTRTPDRTERRSVWQVFRLMLQTETESIVLEAILEGLQELDPPKQLPSGTPAMSLEPANSPHSRKERQPISASLPPQPVQVSSRI